jgi:Ser/Thr protein kinase RdoA (MazF antagonist)
MNIVDHLTLDALRECWGLKIGALECVDKKEGRWCYKASTNRGPFFVKTQEDREEFLEDLERGVRVQGYLGKEGFPTNGVFPTANGSLLQQWHGYGIVVEPWLERQDFEENSKHWRIFGQLAGRLHALPVPSELQSCISKMDQPGI